MMARAHSMHIGGSIPMVLIRLLLLATAVSAVLLLAEDVPWRVIGSALAIVAAAVPRTMAVWGVVACIVLELLLTEPSMWRTVIAVFVVPLLHMLSGIASTVPLRSRLAARALVPSLRRFLLIQGISQPLAVLTMLLIRPIGVAGAAWLAPLGAGVLVVLSVLFSRRLRDPAGRTSGTGRR